MRNFQVLRRTLAQATGYQFLLLGPGLMSG
jgi:hypothetical protein